MGQCATREVSPAARKLWLEKCQVDLTQNKSQKMDEAKTDATEQRRDRNACSEGDECAIRKLLLAGSLSEDYLVHMECRRVPLAGGAFSVAPTQP